MQILKRAKKLTDGEVVAFNENPESVKEEADRRIAKAGHTRGKTKIMIDAPTDKYRENYVRIFGHD